MIFGLEALDMYIEYDFTELEIFQEDGGWLPVDPVAILNLEKDLISGVLPAEDIRLDEKKLYRVNSYIATRHYGGPEEGGWWYNVSTPIESILVNILNAREKASERLIFLGNIYNEGDINSVLGGQVVDTRIENDEWPIVQPSTRPHYE